MVNNTGEPYDDDPSSIIRPGEGHGLDFVKLPELEKRTGVTPSGVLRFVVPEMLANSLDTDAKHIKIVLIRNNDFYQLSVCDNGSKKFSITDVKMLFSYTNTASSKRGVYRAQRGALGNALKCVSGYTYAIPESLGLVPHDIILSSHGEQYIVKLKPDRIREVIDSDIVQSSVADDGCNTFIVLSRRV